MSRRAALRSRVHVAGARVRGYRPRPVRPRDAGANSLELALLTPILLLVMLMVVQFAMVYHARHVALAAAQGGARVARGEVTGDWQGRAEQTARTQAGQFGARLLGDVAVDAGGDVNERWVEVSGEAVQVIPFFHFRVHQRSGGPIECFRPDVGSGTECEQRQ